MAKCKALTGSLVKGLICKTNTALSFDDIIVVIIRSHLQLLKVVGMTVPLSVNESIELV